MYKPLTLVTNRQFVPYIITVSDLSEIKRLMSCKLATDSSSSAPTVIVSLQIDCDFTSNAFLYGKKLTTLVFRDVLKQLMNIQFLSLLHHTIDGGKLCGES